MTDDKSKKRDPSPILLGLCVLPPDDLLRAFMRVDPERVKESMRREREKRGRET